MQLQIGGGGHAVLLAEGCLDSQELAELMHEAETKWVLMFEVGALKLKMPEARKIRSRTGMFFTLLDGYMLKVDVDNYDTSKFVEMLLG